MKMNEQAAQHGCRAAVVANAMLCLSASVLLPPLTLPPGITPRSQHEFIFEAAHCYHCHKGSHPVSSSNLFPAVLARNTCKHTIRLAHQLV
jgi:hypothetical protein